ncbi:MAG TPA: hypothetical protein VJN18_17415 [Polyangiaceae bacterium]|nr:hypothetical protein [Polyangiaceae bacterium]
MLRLRYLASVVGLSSLVVAACSGDGSGSIGGDGGEAVGGEGHGPDPDPGGAGGEETGAAGGCSVDGSGSVVVEITGLPDGVEADVLVTGPNELGFTVGDTIMDVAAGTYSVSAARVFDADPIVRTVFDPSVDATDFCLADGATQTIEVSYGAIPSSNKLWMPTDQDDELAGYSSFAIATTGITDATVSINGPGSKSVAFDRDGNLWALGPTLADPHVVRFPAASLGESAELMPDISINLPEITCSVALAHLAFDAEGNLWLTSPCLDEVLRVPAADLATSDDKAADALFTGVTNPDGLGFDSDGNLWIGGGPTLLRFDAARLGTVDGDPADLELSVTSAEDANLGLQAAVFAFDTDGNLWGIDLGVNMVFQVPVASLGSSGAQSVQAAVSFAVGITALPDLPVFDDGGGLWLNLTGGVAGGSFGRFSPEQLTMSTGTGGAVVPEVLITSPSIGSGLPLAFFPAPEGLPLFHSLPAP